MRIRKFHSIKRIRESEDRFSEYDIIVMSFDRDKSIDGYCHRINVVVSAKDFEVMQSAIAGFKV